MLYLYIKKILWMSFDTPVPDWFINGMRAVQKATLAINLQSEHFTYKSGVVTAEVKGSDNYKLIDLGIAKAHFEIGAGGIDKIYRHLLLKFLERF